MGPEATMALIGGFLLLLWWLRSGPPKATTPGERAQRDYWRPRAESAAQARDDAELDHHRTRDALVEARAQIEELQEQVARQARALRHSEHEVDEISRRRLDELESECRRARARLVDAVEIARALAASARRALDRHQADAIRVNERGISDLTINGGPIATARDEIERLERAVPDPFGE